MKRLFTIGLAAVLLATLLCSCVGCSKDESGLPSEGLEFLLFEGTNHCALRGIGTCTDTDIIIPQYAPNGQKVIIIINNAFAECKEVKSITVPGTVQTIGEQAFAGCSSLEEVYLSDGVQTIGAYAFAGCSSLEEVYLPDSVQHIHESPFSGCSSLKKVRLPSTIPYIGTLMFSHAGLESFTVPDGVTTIGAYAFQSCELLKSIDIPNSVEIIRTGAFRYCTSLTSIMIPDSVTMIEQDTFWGCTGMTSIVIPKSVTKIEDMAFSGCGNLRDVYYTGTLEEWAAITIKGGNGALNSATVHYNYDPLATE